MAERPQQFEGTVSMKTPKKEAPKPATAEAEEDLFSGSSSSEIETSEPMVEKEAKMPERAEEKAEASREVSPEKAARLTKLQEVDSLLKEAIYGESADMDGQTRERIGFSEERVGALLAAYDLAAETLNEVLAQDRPDQKDLGNLEGMLFKATRMLEIAKPLGAKITAEQQARIEQVKQEYPHLKEEIVKAEQKAASAFAGQKVEAAPDMVQGYAPYVERILKKEQALMAGEQTFPDERKILEVRNELQALENRLGDELARDPENTLTKDLVAKVFEANARLDQTLASLERLTEERAERMAERERKRAEAPATLDRVETALFDLKVQGASLDTEGRKAALGVLKSELNSVADVVLEAMPAGSSAEDLQMQDEWQKKYLKLTQQLNAELTKLTPAETAPMEGGRPDISEDLFSDESGEAPAQAENEDEEVARRRAEAVGEKTGVTKSPYVGAQTRVSGRPTESVDETVARLRAEPDRTADVFGSAPGERSAEATELPEVVETYVRAMDGAAGRVADSQAGTLSLKPRKEGPRATGKTSVERRGGEAARRSLESVQAELDLLEGQDSETDPEERLRRLKAAETDAFELVDRSDDDADQRGKAMEVLMRVRNALLNEMGRDTQTGKPQPVENANAQTSADAITVVTPPRKAA